MGLSARLLAACAGLGGACVAYGTLIERRWYRLRRLTLPGALRPGSDPVDVLHLSDLHLVPPDPPLTRFVRGLPTDVDVVAVTGDVLGAAGAEDAAADLLAGLLEGGARGIAVLGSNDLFAPVPKSPHRYFTHRHAPIVGPRLDAARLIAGLEANGYQLLEGTRARITTAAGTIAVAGLPDPHLDPHRLPPADAVRPDGDGEIGRVALVHAPYTAALDLLVQAGYGVVLAGHTHGGQVRLPAVGALVANCDLPLRRARGASRWDGAWLHVSPGLGTSRYAPFRFGCRPEATVLRLTG